MGINTKAERLTGISPTYIINTCIALALMIGFKYIPAVDPLTPVGMSVIGIFLGMLYGWLIVGDVFWPSIVGLVFLGFSGYTTVPEAFTTGFGNSTVLLLLFFFVFTNIIDDAGLTEYIALWMAGRRFAQGRPYVLSFMILFAMVILALMISMTAAILVIFPIIKRISEVYGFEPGDIWPICMFVGAAFVGSTAYMFLPFKSLPAVIFGTYQSLSGASIEYGPYLIVVFAMTVMAIAGTLVFMKVVFKADLSKITNCKIDISTLAPLTRYQKGIILYFILVVLCLLLPTIAPKTFILAKILNGIGSTGIIAISVVIWAAFNFKDRPTLTQLLSKNVSWSTLFIIAAALTIATAITSEQTGVSNWVVQFLTPIVSGKSTIVFIALIAFIACFLTNVANNVAIAALMAPLTYTIGLACGVDTQALMICMMFGANIGLVTPPASAPAAIIHGDKEWIPGNNAVKQGLVLSTYNFFLIVLISYPLCVLLF